MLKNLGRGGAKLLLGLLLVLPVASAQEVTVQHAQGETTVQLNPAVIFSYDYAAIDTLNTLGVDVQGAPPLAGTKPSWLPAELINIGSLFEPDYEEVNASQPDLVIIAGRSAPAYSELSRMAPTIDLTFGPSFLESLKDNTRTLAAITSKEDEAEVALREIEGKIDSLKEAVAEGGDGLLLMVNGGSLSLLAPSTTSATRGALLYDTLGLTPTIANIEEATHGEPISFEFLLKHDPTWLFVIDRDAAIGTEGAQPAKQVLDNELMRQTRAWQEDRIVYLSPFNWYIISGAGLTNANEMLDEIAAAYERSQAE